jgi:hypothetical protein
MKKLLVILMILTACSEDEPDTDKGCQTGISKQTGQRELIRCCTQQQALAGDNVQAGGTPNFTNYTNHKWAPCDDCK